jgi:hypothetical protein
MKSINKYRRLIHVLPIVITLALVSCGGEKASELTPVSNNVFQEVPIGATPTSGIKLEVLEACNKGAQASALINVKDFVELHPERGAYEGKALITYLNTTDDIQEDLVFRLYPNAERIYGGQVKIASIYVDGYESNPQVFLPDRTGLRVPLAEPISPGESVVVEMKFEGHLSDGIEGAPDAYGIFNYSIDDDVMTLANWYPILARWEEGEWQAQPVSGVGDAVVSDVSLYLVEVIAPEDSQVITTGSEINHGFTGGNEVFTFASGPVREFIIISGTKFIPIQTEAAGVQVNHWGLPGGEGRSSEALQATVDSLSVFSELFGPYPYRELDVVSVPLQRASGVEYPGLFLIRDDLYYPDKERPYRLSTVIAHETAHQWWYGLVGNDVLDHPWQDEALTTFTSLLYLEQFQPLVYSSTVDYFTKVSQGLEQNTDIGRPTSSFIHTPEDYGPIIYSHGSLIFTELRDEIGDQDFFTALRSYYDNNIYQIASPQDLLAEFSSACQCNLDQVFDRWGVK